MVVGLVEDAPVGRRYGAHRELGLPGCLQLARGDGMRGLFFFSSRRRHTRYWRDWSSDVCSSDLGSTASFTAVGTSYATHGEPMVPIYIFYSMFGFQRTGDSFWAAADQMTRGFVLGATAGRTTLNGEGLQHEDGHSLLLAQTNPAVVSYDPAFSYEVGHITKDRSEEHT